MAAESLRDQIQEAVLDAIKEAMNETLVYMSPSATAAVDAATATDEIMAALEDHGTTEFRVRWRVESDEEWSGRPTHKTLLDASEVAAAWRRSGHETRIEQRTTLTLPWTPVDEPGPVEGDGAEGSAIGQNGDSRDA